MKYIIDAPSDLYKIDGTLRVPVKVGEGDLSWYNTYLKAEIYTEPNRNAIEDEVWSFAWKIFSMDIGEYAEIFDDKGCSSDYREAKAKYEEWKKQKDEIRVGDEVEYGFIRGIAFVVDEVMVKGFYINDKERVGEPFLWNKKDCEKTGRHFPEVAELLKKMRGEEQ